MVIIWWLSWWNLGWRHMRQFVALKIRSPLSWVMVAMRNRLWRQSSSWVAGSGSRLVDWAWCWFNSIILPFFIRKNTRRAGTQISLLVTSQNIATTTRNACTLCAWYSIRSYLSLLLKLWVMEKWWIWNSNLILHTTSSWRLSLYVQVRQSSSSLFLSKTLKLYFRARGDSRETKRSPWMDYPSGNLLLTPNLSLYKPSPEHVQRQTVSTICVG